MNRAPTQSLPAHTALITTDGQGTGSTLQRTPSLGPPVPAPDVVAVLDPASLGGGGPLQRISTQRSARTELAAHERATVGRIDSSTRTQDVPAGTSTSHLPGILRGRRPRFLGGLSHHHEESSPGPSPRASSSRPLINSEISSGGLVDTPGPEKEDGEKDPCAPAEHGDIGQEDEVHEYPDGGYGWVVLVCCIALAGCTVGWGTNWGVFQAYYSQHVFPDTSQAYISIIGTIQGFLMNSAAFIFGRLGDRLGYKTILYPSAIVTWLGIFLASRSTTVWQLLLTQGILTGIGQGMALPLFMSLPSQWFYKYRGFASGSALAGAGLGGGIGTIIIQRMIEPLGYQKTLMIMSFIVLFVELVAVTLIRTRPTSPEARNRGRGPWIDKRVLRKSEFYSIGLGMVVAVLGYAVPWFYLQEWVNLEVPSVGGTLPALPATLVSWFLVIGRSCAGLAADKFGPLNTFVAIFFLASLSQLCLWYTAKTFAQVIVFSIVYGIVAPGYLGLIPQIVVQLFGAENLASNVGILLFFNGPGNLINGIMAGAIFDASGRTTFKWVIITDVICQAAGGAITIWARYKASHKLLAKV